MATLIAVISSGKGTWGQVLALINNFNWDRVFLVCNDFSYENFEINPSKALKLKLNERDLEESHKKLSDVFNKEIKDLDVAVNISSGTGFEHMIVLSAILRAGLGLRFIYAQDKEIKEFEIFDGPFIREEE